MCKTCGWKEFAAEVDRMRKLPEYAWNGYLELLRREVLEAEHVSEQRRRHVADVVRRTREPEFARQYAAPVPPDPLWETLEAQRRRVYALAREAGYPADVVLYDGVSVEGPALWGYWITGAKPALLARLEPYLNELITARHLAPAAPAELRCAA